MNKILTTEDSSVVTASKLSKAVDEVVVCVHKIACEQARRHEEEAERESIPDN